MSDATPASAGAIDEQCVEYAFRYPDGTLDEPATQMTRTQADDHLRSLRAWAEQSATEETRALVAVKLVRRTTYRRSTPWEDV